MHLSMQWQTVDGLLNQLHATLGACNMTERPSPAPLAHSPDGAAMRLQISPRAIYALIAKGELRSFKAGKRRLIPDTELQQFVQRKMAQAGAA